MGQILTAGEGQNPARQAAMAAGCPKETTAWGLNQLCGSGLRTVAIGMQQIATGDAKHHRRRRPGIDVDGAARRASARRREDGRPEAGRHHDQGRPDRTPSTATTWATPPRTSRASGSSPATSRTSSRSPRRTRPRPRRRPASSRTRSSPSRSRAARATSIVDDDEYIKHGATHGRHRQAAPGLRQGRHGDRGQRLGHQ